MIFINCITEELVQVNDKTRIDISKSFVSGNKIVDIEIKPDDNSDFISVFSSNQASWFLDWSYATNGIKNITVKATDGSNIVTQIFNIEIISESEDNLFSNDSQIFAIESELKNYFQDGRNSYKNLHREAQSRILNYLDRKRIWNENGDPLNKFQINKSNEMQKWSLYETIFMIYTDLFVSVGDKFAEKVNQYKMLRNNERDRASLRIDRDSSGQIDNNNEIQDLKSFRLIKR